MRTRSRKTAVFLITLILLAAASACNLPEAPAQNTPIHPTATVAVPAIYLQPTSTVSPETAVPTGTSEEPGSGSSPGPGGSGPFPGVDSDVIASVNVKNGSASSVGEISFPGNDSSDEITIKPVGFDSTVTSGSLVFTLTCSGKGKAKVNYKGGVVTNGSPGCGETWSVSVVNGGPDSHLTIHLDGSGDVKWTLSVISGD